MENPIRALVVDDLADARQMLANLLEASGWEAASASGGQAGMELADALHPHVVFIDLAMPFMDGFELAQHLRIVKPRPILIAVSGHAESATLEHCEQAGFNLHVQKPLTTERLAELVAQVTARVNCSES